MDGAFTFVPAETSLRPSLLKPWACVDACHPVYVLLLLPQQPHETGYHLRVQGYSVVQVHAREGMELAQGADVHF